MSKTIHKWLDVSTAPSCTKTYPMGHDWLPYSKKKSENKTKVRHYKQFGCPSHVFKLSVFPKLSLSLCSCGLKWALRTSTQPENSIWCVCCRACLSPANLGPQPQASHLRQRVAFKEHNVTQNCVLTFAVWERRWKDFNVQSHIIYRDISSLLWNSFMEVVSLLTCYVNFGKSVNLSGILDKVQII